MLGRPGAVLGSTELHIPSCGSRTLLKSHRVGSMGTHVEDVQQRSFSISTTIGNNTLVSLWMCRWVSASISASPS